MFGRYRTIFGLSSTGGAKAREGLAADLPMMADTPREQSLGPARRRRSRDHALAVFTYDTVPGVPPVSVMKLRPGAFAWVLPEAHSHDFLILYYFERDGGSMWLADRKWRIEAGDAYIVGPGEIIDPTGLEDEAEGWAVFFRPEFLGSRAPSVFLLWRAHPLLFPFVRSSVGGAHHLKVPPADRPSWSERLVALDLELRQRQNGYGEAVLAQLTLLLVAVSRLSADIVSDLRLNQEPLLAEVFGVIEKSFRERLSLKDVAAAVNISPGHLTTVVRRKTGRTVQEWIVERRMGEARRLLVETDLGVEQVCQRIGYNEPSYFVRSFKRAHGTTPLAWRRAGRP
jgi:AraC family transcriptional regulator, transcriptional activator of pobA